jgi:hypothetical protein
VAHDLALHACKVPAKAAQGEHIQIQIQIHIHIKSIIFTILSQAQHAIFCYSCSIESNEPYIIQFHINRQQRLSVWLRSSKISSSVNGKLGTTNKSSDFSFPIPNPARAIQSPQRLLKSSNAIRSRYQTPPMPPNLPPSQQNSKEIASPDSLRTSGTAGGGDGEKPPRPDGRKNKKKNLQRRGERHQQRRREAGATDLGRAPRGRFLRCCKKMVSAGG